MTFNKHIVNAINNHELKSDTILHVIGVISNPARFHSRYRLARQWIESMQKTKHVRLYLVELAFGDRHHELTDASNPAHLQLRGSGELWHKENLINLGRRLLPHDARYVCWEDADVYHENENWALETIHQLQHYPVVQTWSECTDMGPYGNALSLFHSFAKLAHQGVRMQTCPTQPYQYGHSGFSWACTREFWENTKGLLDFAILGSADHHMAWAMLNHVDWSVHGGMSEEFKRRAREWQRNAYRVTHGHIGYVPGMLKHFWHGKKRDRKYRERWQILIEHKFNPDTHLRYDSQGLLQLVNHPHLEEDIRKYCRQRNEDSIDEC